MALDPEQDFIDVGKLLESSKLQQREDSFQRVYEKGIALTDGEEVRPELATRLSCFELWRNLLYHLAQRTLEGEQ